MRPGLKRIQRTVTGKIAGNEWPGRVVRVAFAKGAPERAFCAVSVKVKLAERRNRKDNEYEISAE